MIKILLILPLLLLDTALVLVYKEHGLVPEIDTVRCTAIWQSGAQWYCKGLDEKDYWSDKYPKIIRRGLK